MRIIKLGLTATLISLMCASCTGNKQTKEEKKEEISSVSSVEIQNTGSTFYGTYQGVLPAADCEGIKTILTLRDDTTYDLESHYLGSKEDRPIITSGVYNKLGDGLLELVTPSSGTKTYYKVITDGVALTDSTGVLNKGELASRYILRKTK